MSKFGYIPEGFVTCVVLPWIIAFSGISFGILLQLKKIEYKFLSNT